LEGVEQFGQAEGPVLEFQGNLRARVADHGVLPVGACE
jgi:hypothetical protein